MACRAFVGRAFKFAIRVAVFTGCLGMNAGQSKDLGVIVHCELGHRV